MLKKYLLSILLFTIILSSTVYFVGQSHHHPSITQKIKSSAAGMHEGDLIFQSSTSGQSMAVQLATHSKYSHCGIIFKDENEFYVYEAVQPVKKTKLNEWIRHGDDQHYVIKRLKNSDEVLTEANLKAMKETAISQLNKDYDITFEWSDDKLYCSEYIWKIYDQGAHFQLAPLQKLRDFDLTHDIVKKVLQERYGKQIPLDETVISPGNIFDSPKLELVIEKN